MSDHPLTISSLRSGYGEAIVLRGINLTIAPSHILAVVGKNGMGKSTLLKSIMGYLPKSAGAVKIRGHEVTGWAPHRIARLGVGYVAQEKALFQDLTVEQNIRLALRPGTEWRTAIECVERTFPFLMTRLTQRAGTLSGGEQKMLLTARAIASGAKVLLIDEITEGLQPSVIERLASVIRAECERSRLAVLLIEQNIPFTLSVADRYSIMDRGEIAYTGSAKEAGAARNVTKFLSV
ncbi:ABC transporter ATP-binding protein [Microvirga massiliensis]|uniref:branched-chain amino acid ABC transporter ATP-binding protein n=1 Tax=Microvirga massiliensis TaxID=1033741 RepID=UPI00062B9B2F|nr:ABC transporter ATP-binding protein [Microvirga massiliensis]